MKECKNIFVDTSIFEKECFRFDEKSGIAKLIEYKNNGDIKLYITDIIKDEIISRIKYNVKEEYSKYKKLRIIKNICFKTEDDFVKELTEKFILNIKHFEIINTNSKITKSIFENYFNNKPPFDKEKESKKHEFPDAFIIATVRQWAETNRKKAIFLSADNDCETYINSCNGLLCLKKDISGLLDDINKENDCYELSNSIYNENSDNIADELEYIVENIPIEKYGIYYASMRDYKDGFCEPEFVLDSLDYNGNFKILQRDIVYIDSKNKQGYINFKVSYEVNAYFEMDDYSEATHDSEEDIYYNVKHISKNDKYEIVLDDLEVLIDIENKDYEVLSESDEFYPEIKFYEPISD